MKNSMKTIMKGAAAFGVACVLAASAKSAWAEPGLGEGFDALKFNVANAVRTQKTLAQARPARTNIVAADYIVSEGQYDVQVFDKALRYKCDPFVAADKAPRCPVVTSLCPSTPPGELDTTQAMDVARAAQQGLLDADAFFDAYRRTCDFGAAKALATPNLIRVR